MVLFPQFAFPHTVSTNLHNLCHPITVHNCNSSNSVIKLRQSVRSLTLKYRICTYFHESSEIWSSHDDEDVSRGILDCDALWFCRWKPFRMNISSPSLGWKLRRYVPPKRRSVPIRPHGVTTTIYKVGFAFIEIQLILNITLPLNYV
jgi:hypothetical protein